MVGRIKQYQSRNKRSISEEKQKACEQLKITIKQMKNQKSKIKNIKNQKSKTIKNKNEWL